MNAREKNKEHEEWRSNVINMLEDAMEVNKGVCQKMKGAF